jgi:hypothetical protein
MKRSDFLPVTLLLILATVVGIQVRGTHYIAQTGSAAILGAPAAPAKLARGSKAARRAAAEAAAKAAAETPLPLVVEASRGRDATRRIVRLNETGTYIGEILVGHDSALARWPERETEPLKIWVAPTSDLTDWRPVFVEKVRDAFEQWERTGIPVRFAFVPDSARADVHVTWLDHFAEPISGKTLWARDDRWWIVDGDISIAVHHNGGQALDASAVRAIALHEVGHLLGLNHTADTTSIMTPKIRVRDLSAADRATVRLLYMVPAGSLK